MHKLNCRLGNLRLCSIIGAGAYGTVYAAIDIYSHKQYAVKVLSKHDELRDCRGQVVDAVKLSLQHVSLASLDPRSSHLYREIALHHHVQVHPYILSLHQVWEAADCVYIVLEHCADDLFSAIVDKGMFQSCAGSAKIVLLQLLEAVLYSHNRGVYHCDLKPENVLVADGGTSIRLADFGLASRSGQQVSQCGSSFYMSPERQSRRSASFPQVGPSVAQINAQNAAADVWSLGVIAINLFCGRNPWKRAHITDEAYQQYLKDPAFLQQILPVSAEFADILHRVFRTDIRHRISLMELRERIKRCTVFVTSQSSTVPEQVSQASAPTDATDDSKTTQTTSGKSATATATTSSTPTEDLFDFETGDNFGRFEKAPRSTFLLPAPSLKSNPSPLSQASSVSPLSHTSSIFSTPYTPDVSPTAVSDRGVKRRRSEENEPFHFSLNHTSDDERFDFGLADPRTRLFA